MRYSRPLGARLDGLHALLTNDQGSGWGVLIAAAVAVALLVLYLASMFLGAALSILAGYFEFFALDPRQAKKLNLQLDQYREQWQLYVDSLETAKNPYISRYVDHFLFTLRAAFAIAIVSVLFLALSPLPIWLPVTGLAAALLAGIVAADHHGELAKFRNRRFPLENRVKTDDRRDAQAEGD